MENDFELKLTDTLSLYYEVAINDILDKTEKNPHVFSDSFERKMEKLIKKHKKPWYRLVSTPAKKIAAVIILAIILSFSTAMTIRASREAIIKFFVEMYETFSVVFFGEVDPDTGEPRFASEDNDNSGVITDIYEITYIPEGYELVEKHKSNSRVLYKYRHNKGITISFTYFPFDTNIKTVVDTEKVDISSFTINQKEYRYVCNENNCHIVWEENGYSFSLIAEDLKMGQDMIKSINLIKK